MSIEITSLACESPAWYRDWSFWLKLLVPTLTIIVSILWAQRIFNRNALRRENRERRICVLDELHKQTVELRFNASALGNTLPDKIPESISLINSALQKLESTSRIYFGEAFLGHIDAVTSALGRISTEARNASSESSDNGSTVLQYVYAADEVLDDLVLCFDSLASLIAEIHSEIEKAKYFH